MEAKVVYNLWGLRLYYSAYFNFNFLSTLRIPPNEHTDTILYEHTNDNLNEHVDAILNEHDDDNLNTHHIASMMFLTFSQWIR